jgi:hypothetical protein
MRSLIISLITLTLGTTSTCFGLPSINLVKTSSTQGRVHVTVTAAGSIGVELSLVMTGGLELWHPVVNSEIFDQPNPGDSPFIQGEPTGGDSFGLNVDDQNNRLFLSYGSVVLPGPGTWKVFDFGFTGAGSVSVGGWVAQNGVSIRVPTIPGTTTASVSPIVGDFNADRFVNAADYTIWRDSVGREGIGLDADANRDGVVNQDDYSLWAGAYNPNVASAASLKQGAAAAPEPATVVMALSMAAFLICLQRPK